MYCQVPHLYRGPTPPSFVSSPIPMSGLTIDGAVSCRTSPWMHVSLYFDSVLAQLLLDTATRKPTYCFAVVESLERTSKCELKAEEARFRLGTLSSIIQDALVTISSFPSLGAVLTSRFGMRCRGRSETKGGSRLLGPTGIDQVVRRGVKEKTEPLASHCMIIGTSALPPWSGACTNGDLTPLGLYFMAAGIAKCARSRT
jgi:hypothetical protein